MRILEKLTAAVFLVSVGACVAEDAAPPEADNELDWRAGGKGDGQTCEFDAQSATTYLNNFLYKDVGSETGGGHRYRVGFTFDRRAILANGDTAELTTYLLPAGRAIVEYSEVHGNEVKNETVVVSRYSVDATTRALKIDGVGTGAPATANDNGRCAPAYDFTYAGNLRTAGLDGGTTRVYAGTTSAILVDPDHLDDVPYPDTRRWFQEDVASGKIVVIHK